MRKGQFFGRVGLTRNERRLGRMIRDGEGHPDPAAGGSNNGGAAGGNAGDSASGGGDSNNTSDGFDAAAFWGGQGGDNSSSSNSGGSADDDSSSGNSGGDGNFAQNLANQIQSLSFGDPVFTAEITEQINNGDFAGFQKNLDSHLQAAVRQSLAMNVQILRPFAEQLLSQVRQEITQTLSGRDDSDTLVRDFPAAKDPKVAPMIRQVFQQALQNTGGNREKAVAQTKQMIGLLTNTVAPDLNLEVAPRGPGDSGRQTQAVNWLDELTGR